jgi:hypothetical protein
VKNATEFSKNCSKVCFDLDGGGTSTQKMEAANSSETEVTIFKNTRCQNP